MGKLLWVAIAITALALTANDGWAQSADSVLDINLNDDAVRGSFAWRLGNPKLQADAGWLHHQDRGDIGHLGLHLVDIASATGNGVQAGIGGKLFYTDPDAGGVDGTVLGLGGFIRYILPQYNRFSVSGHLYFAPDVVSFGDATQYREFEARASYNVLRQGDVYIGMRYANAEYEVNGGDADLTIDNGLHIGIQLRF